MIAMRSSVGVALAAMLTAGSAMPSPVAEVMGSRPEEILVARQMQDTNETSTSLGAVDVPASSAGTTCVSSNGAEINSFDPPLYTENLRPQIHFSPSNEFMNDPNGLVRSGDVWHLYFQYNPEEPVAGNQHWGHATSLDLHTWQNHLPAIAPENDDEGIFSGSAVLDVNNTSGFFDDDTEPESRFVAIYTLNTPEAETQNIAYSTDGFNYTKFEGNPVIDRNTTQFRDPKVFWDDITSQWVMTITLPQSYEVAFYGSPDLREWTELSLFGPIGTLGYQYEVPDLISVPIEGGPRDGERGWVLALSINPGSIQGGSSIQYFMGDWNGTVFTPKDGRTQLMDFGKDFYAGITWYNAPNDDAIMTAWASNWQYTNVAPTSPWRGATTLPRKLTLRWTEYNPMYWDYQLTQSPYETIETLEQQSLTDDSAPAQSGNQTVELTGDGAFDVRANFSLAGDLAANASYSTATVTVLTNDENQNLTMGFLIASGNPIVTYVDRRFAGADFANSNPYFTDKFSSVFMPIRSTPNDTTSDVLVDMRVVIDRSLTEVFVQEGRASAAVLTFWDGDDTRPTALQIGTFNGVEVTSLSASAINSTWPRCP